MTFSTWNPLSWYDMMLIALWDTIWPVFWTILVILYWVVLFACAVSTYGGDWWNG